MSESACPVDESTRQAWLDQQRSSGSGSNARPFGAPAATSLAPPPSQHPDLSGSLGAQGNNDLARTEAFLAVRSGRRPAFLSNSSAASASSSSAAAASSPVAAAVRTARGAMGLSTEREISSIPRSRSTPSAIPGGAGLSAPVGASAGEEEEERWVYPSPSQFYAALARKNRDPQAADMSIVVPIHNAVNERAWQSILSWERQFHPECACCASPSSSSSSSSPISAQEGSSPVSSKASANGGVKLISFIGKPQERSIKALLKTKLGGYAEPFDRHDWLVDRCGREVRYVIDFYSGRASSSSSSASTSGPGAEDGKGLVNAAAAAQGPNLSFYLDVRPAPDSLDNIWMRMRRFALGESKADA